MDKVKYSIIGAGVIGLAIADAFSKKGDGDVVVFDKYGSFGQETSSRNSEVIHAGLYYPPDSLKSRLCIKGNRLLYKFCAERNVPHSNCGKLVVSTNEAEVPKIKSIYENAVKSGVPGIKLLSKDDIKGLEPSIKAYNGLYSETTGIIDSHQFMKTLYEDCCSRGVMFAFSSEVKGIKKSAVGSRQSAVGYVLTYGNSEELESEYVINAAGLGSEQIAKMAGLDAEKLGYKLHFCKGDYFKVSGKPYAIRHLVYPPPEEKGAGLGIHATLDLSGHIRLGPDTAYVKDLNYDIDPKKAKEFFESAVTYLPWLKEDALSPDTAGMRPKLQGPDDGFRDFIIKEESENGLPNFIDLIGIESPGLTASMAIGEYVAGLFKL